MTGYDSWKTDYPSDYDFDGADALEVPEDASHDELIAAGFEEIEPTASAYWLAGIISDDELDEEAEYRTDIILFGKSARPARVELPLAA